MPGKDQLVEKVALELIRLEKGDVALGHRHQNTPTWRSALVQARAAVEVVEARYREQIERMITRCQEDYDRDPQAYHRGREDELSMLLDELGNKEGEQEAVLRDAGASGATTDGVDNSSTEEGEK